MKTTTTMIYLALLGGLALALAGCNLEPPPPEDDDDAADDDAADDDAADDDAGDDDAGDDDAGDDDAGDDDAGDDDAGDDDMSDDDVSDDDSGDDDTAPPVSIYDIQGGSVADQTMVTIEGVVITSPVADAPPGFFVQVEGSESSPEYSGIYVYIYDTAAAKQLAGQLSVGDKVDVHGLYKEYYDFSEIEISAANDVTVVGSGTVAPVVVAACDVGTGGGSQEAYEGVLVTVENVTVSDENPDEPNDYGEFVVDSCLRVDDLFHDAAPTLDDTFGSVTGPMYYSHGDSKIVPRAAADLVP